MSISLFTFLNTALGAPVSWEPLLVDGSILSDLDSTQNSTDWSGPAEYAQEDNVFYLRFSVYPPLICDPSDDSLRWRVVFSSDGLPSNPSHGIEWTCASVTLGELSNWTGSIVQIGDLVYDEIVSIESNSFIITLPLLDLPIELLSQVSIGAISFEDGIPIDVLGTPDGALNQIWSDPLTLDSDSDGLSESLEIIYGTDPTDGDSDDDGLVDGQEYVLGSDPYSCDTDGDRILDGTEAGVRTAHPDTNLEIEGCFKADTNPLSTTDPTNPDTDGGGSDDGFEDRNQDGHVANWEGDPTDPMDDPDSDEDGIQDIFEVDCPNGLSDDADGDGILDTSEMFEDSDSDTIPNFCDDDDDGDGLPTLDEGEDDYDQDGLPNYLDTDSDDDGLSDTLEGFDDNDCDEKFDYLDNNPSDGPCSDDDHDGLTNPEEIECGTDPLLPDTDLDGILDFYECNEQEDAPSDFDPNSPNSLDKDPMNESKFGCQKSGFPSLWMSLIAFLIILRRKVSSCTDIG